MQPGPSRIRMAMGARERERRHIMSNRTLVQLGAAAAAGAVVFLASCASTTLQSTWMDPSFTGGPFKKVFVMGLAPNETSRRVFEDIMVARLQAAGVQAVPAYQFIPED